MVERALLRAQLHGRLRHDAGLLQRVSLQPQVPKYFMHLKQATSSYSRLLWDCEMGFALRRYRLWNLEASLSCLVTSWREIVENAADERE